VVEAVTLSVRSESDRAYVKEDKLPKHIMEMVRAYRQLADRSRELDQKMYDVRNNVGRIKTSLTRKSLSETPEGREQLATLNELKANLTSKLLEVVPQQKALPRGRKA